MYDKMKSIAIVNLVSLIIVASKHERNVSKTFLE